VCDSENEFEEAAKLERRTLIILLAINFGMFLLEVVIGWIASSSGVLADSLDMLADASVYAIALYAVGRSLRIQSNAATAAGFLQIALGVGVLVDVGRRLIVGSEPVSTLMMGIGVVALVANVICLVLIAKHRHGGVHMRASWIFSATDVLANIGIIVSGALVLLTGSRIPDLVIGAVIAAIVIRGGIHILREVREERAEGARERPA
jgi:Co/Zn/Cd efflux system component